MPRKKKPNKRCWSKLIEECGISVRLYERENSSSVWYSVRAHDGRKIQKSLRIRDRNVAEVRAKEIAQGVARERVIGADIQRGITLGQLFAVYRRHQLPTLKPYRKRYAETYAGMFLAAWGPDLPVCDVDQSRVDTYVADRRSLAVLPPPFQPNEAGRMRRGGRKPTTPRDGTLDSDFRWLSSVFNWARKRKEGGTRLISENPLDDVRWPREQNVRRPVARHERFTATMQHVHRVDPEGRLGCILALARWTGRRESAICGLRASDVLLSEDRTLVALAEAGMDESMVVHMPHGAIRWSDAGDKMGLLFISPISGRAREAVDAYLSQSPRVGDVPLFPSPRNPAEPISRHAAATWLLRAERLAELPKLVGGTFHPYRRLWANERKGMSDIDVAHAAGWKDPRAMKLSYQKSDPATVLRVVELTG